MLYFLGMDSCVSVAWTISVLLIYGDTIKKSSIFGQIVCANRGYHIQCHWRVSQAEEAKTTGGDGLSVYSVPGLAHLRYKRNCNNFDTGIYEKTNYLVLNFS